MNSVQEWLRQIGLGEYAEVFARNDVDFDVLPELTEQDLAELGVSLGDRKRLLKAIRTRSAGAPGDPARAAHGGDAERRQLTVLFCDLVGSTELSARLDPEDLRDVMRVYQDCLARVIGGLEGHIARFMGDGALACFGYPKAHEDDAERAVRAGLELIEAIGELHPRPDVALAVRIGIATGVVVVGDLISEAAEDRDSVAGETPNLAARLQAISPPGAVLVAPSTRRLVAGVFELSDFGEHGLKGFAGPIQAWRVLGFAQAEGRFEAQRSTALTPLIGREHELKLLLDRWREAAQGRGQVVLLSGEAGIGKSRITRALAERLGDEAHTTLRYHCSPYHANSALHPVIEQLERAAGFARDDATAAKLDKLEALIARSGLVEAQAAPLLAGLLGVPTNGRYAPLDLGPQRQRQRTLELLVEQVAGLAARQPVLAVYEDIHWMDPSSLDLLGMIIERAQHLRALIVVTYRPEFDPPWASSAHVRSMSLGRLSRRDGAVLVEGVSGGKALPPSVLEQIVAKTDGVPLFVEELTKTVLESGLLREAGDRYELAGPLGELAIPMTLHASLMARLDRLAPVKDVAQIGAVIGREFSYDLLAAVAGFNSTQLSAALGQLVGAELIFQRGTPPQASYSFKHALIQDAAYQGLLKRRRNELHGRIVQIVETRFPEIADAEPELLAHHLTQAGATERAVAYWAKAGQQALARSGTAEAIAHLRAGLDALARMPEGPARRSLELDLQLALGGALAAGHGHGAPETGETYARAVALAEEMGRTGALYPALDGLMTCHFSRAELADAIRLGEEFLSLARAGGDSGAQIIAHQNLGTARLSRGELHAARQHFEAAIALYDPVQHDGLKLTYSYDPEVICSGYLSWVLFAFGQIEKALEHSTRSVAKAHTVGHPLSLGFALSRSAALHQLRREVGAVKAAVDALDALAQKQGFGTYMTVASFYRGWALVQRDRPHEGGRLLREGLAALRASKDEDFFPHTLSLVAEALGRQGEVEQALELVREGLWRVERNQERWFAAELHRLEGELLTAERPEAAEACFRQAIALAGESEARMWQLRAAVSLARLWRDRGRARCARDLLAPIYRGFAEGFEMPDLVEARSLLRELA